MRKEEFASSTMWHIVSVASAPEDDALNPCTNWQHLLDSVGYLKIKYVCLGGKCRGHSEGAEGIEQREIRSKHTACTYQITKD